MTSSEAECNPDAEDGEADTPLAGVINYFISTLEPQVPIDESRLVTS
jgi:hypothetical protein